MATRLLQTTMEVPMTSQGLIIGQPGWERKWSKKLNNILCKIMYYDLTVILQ